MGCFFGCFRVKDSNANLVTPSEPAAPRSKNALSSLFQCDDASLRKGEEGRNQLPGGLGAAELKDEAKFLKARGILSETPVKIQKVLGKWEVISAPNEAGKSSKLNSLLPNASIGKLKSEKQYDESPMPLKTYKEGTTGSGSVDSPSSCMTDGHNTERASSSCIQRSVQNLDTPMVKCNSEAHSEISSVSTQVYASSVRCTEKSVCFHYAQDRSASLAKGSSSECVSPHSQQSGSAGMRSVTKPSPYPTPLELNEDIQTPGTVYPGYRNDMTSGQFSNIRSQYVKSDLDPADNPTQWNELKDESSDSNRPSESLKLIDEDNSISTPVADLSVRKEMENEASLSSWLKPVSKQDDNNKRLSFISSENVHRRKTPVDRPILGMVAAHWNDEETSHISPKWWDGNGIPNSTNKYKEDQKVSWHATPFEERLEKALSEETLISQRKPLNRTTSFEQNESEESDTALSHLQSSAHLKSVISF